MEQSTAETIADGIERQLDPRWIPCQRILAAIPTVIVAGVSFVFVISLWAASRILLLGLLLLPVWAVVMAAIAWQLHRWPAVAYRHASYRLDGEGIEITRGVYWRTITNVPRSRVQHTDVSQGPLERRYGLGTLVVYTAGTMHSQVTLSGLDFDRGPAHPRAPAARRRRRCRLIIACILRRSCSRSRAASRAFLLPAIVLLVTTGRSSRTPRPGRVGAGAMDEPVDARRHRDRQLAVLAAAVPDPQHDRGRSRATSPSACAMRARSSSSAPASSFATSATCRMRGSRTSTR